MPLVVVVVVVPAAVVVVLVLVPVIVLVRVAPTLRTPTTHHKNNAIKQHTAQWPNGPTSQARWRGWPKATGYIALESCLNLA